MQKLKEKGYNLNLTNLIIHRINKTAGERKPTLKLADKPLKIGKPEIRFLADVRESFNKKSLPTHGIFEDAMNYNEFQQAIRDYKNKDIDFIEFSARSMKYYKRTIETSAPATGGFMIFADFMVTDKNDERYILIFSIDNKEGYSLSQIALKIQQIQNIELSKMDLASIINLTRWEQSNNPALKIKTYLTFIRGKKNISDYFQNFIGCADKTTATESSLALLNALKSYAVDRRLNEGQTQYVKNKVLGYCQECHKRKTEILLSTISQIINEEYPEDFSSYASDEKFGTGEIIKYDSKTLRTLKYIDYESDDLTIKFNRELLGNRVKFNKANSSITISDVPEELIAQLPSDEQ